MPQTPTNQFIVQRYKGFGGNFVDSQYLGASYYTDKPYVFQGVLEKTYSSTDMFTGKPLLAEFGGKKKITIPSEIFRWHLQDAERRNITILENLDSANVAPALNHGLIRLRVSDNMYAYPEVLLTEDNSYHLEIVGNPEPASTGYVLTLKLQGDDPTRFVDPAVLTAGKTLYKGWTTVPSEMNDDGGGTQYDAPYKLESQLSFFAQRWTVTNKAWRDSGRLGIEFWYTSHKTGKQQLVRSFLPYSEAKNYDEFYMNQEVQHWLGEKSTSAGPRNYLKRTGPGVRAQLRNSWREFAPLQPTTKLFIDFALDIFFSRENEQNRSITFFTGQLGSLQWHDALAADARSFLTMTTDSDKFVRNASGYSNPSLSLGYQFREYEGPLGIKIKLAMNPINDKREYCGISHPLYPNIPIDSARFTALKIGSSNGPNVRMLEVENTFAWGHIPGTISPTGPVKGGMTSSGIGGYTCFLEGSSGINIEDPSNCGEIIPNVA